MASNVLGRSLFVALLAAGWSGCTAEATADTAGAGAVVEELQQAFLTGEPSRCRPFVTAESARALHDLPWAALRERQPLTVLDTTFEAPHFRVRVRDPNQGNAIAEMIVVREYGRLVVDLVATAGLTAKFTERPLAEERFEPQELAPADIDRARQMQLAQPPK
ncbi:MAG: hypothetical protein NXI31_24385 [bacterium]|nr:hypothetical protein [bacterium]